MHLKLLCFIASFSLALAADQASPKSVKDRAAMLQAKVDEGKENQPPVQRQAKAFSKPQHVKGPEAVVAEQLKKERTREEKAQIATETLRKLKLKAQKGSEEWAKYRQPIEEKEALEKQELTRTEARSKMGDDYCGQDLREKCEALQDKLGGGKSKSEIDAQPVVLHRQSLEEVSEEIVHTAHNLHGLAESLASKDVLPQTSSFPVSPVQVSILFLILSILMYLLKLKI
jgi:hypothetical protein